MTRLNTPDEQYLVSAHLGVVGPFEAEYGGSTTPILGFWSGQWVVFGALDQPVSIWSRDPAAVSVSDFPENREPLACYDTGETGCLLPSCESAISGDGGVGDTQYPLVVNENWLKAADLHGVDLTGWAAQQWNLAEANLLEATLAGADLSGANLALADLTLANLSGANLAGARLVQANLTYADLSGANLTGANLAGARLDHVRYDTATVWPEGVTPPRSS